MKNLLVNRAVSTAKKNFNLRWLLVPILLIILGVGNAWGDTTGSYTLSSSDNNKTKAGTDGSSSWNIGSGAIGTNAGGTLTKLVGTITVTLPAGSTLNSVTVNKGSTWGGSARVLFQSGSTTLKTFSTNETFNLTNHKTDLTYKFVYSGSGNAWVSSISVTYTSGGSTKTLSSAVSPVESGSVELGKTSLAPDESTTATATANDGYEFSSWEISGTGASLSSASTNPTTVTMGSADATVTANFSCVTPAFSTNLSTTPVNYTTGASASALTVAASANNASITYLWQSSTNGSSWSSASGTNNTASYTPSTASAGTMYYRCIATNAASGCSTYATSNVATIIVSTPALATITLNNYSGSATTTGYHSGESFTLPSTNDFTCGELTFVGWSSVEIANSATKPSVATYHEPGESVTLGASNTFYAVFAEASGGGTSSEELTADELTTNITNTTCAYGSEKTYTDNSKITYAFSCWTDVASRPWVQMKKDDSNAYIKITAPGNITQVDMTITSATNVSGGVTDISKHEKLPVETIINLNTEKTNGTSYRVAYVAGDGSSTSRSIVVSSPANTILYLQPTGGACHIWGITVHYSSVSYSNYRTGCTETCGAPTNPTNTSITAYGATIGWTGGGTGTLDRYEYAVWMDGDDEPTSGFTSNGTNTSNALTGLLSNTTYRWKVRKVCTGGDGESMWLKSSFTTSNVALTFSVPTGASAVQGQNSDVALPSAEVPTNCGDCWAFVGWTTAEHAESSSAPAKLFASDAIVHLAQADGSTLYAVYKKDEFKLIKATSQMENNGYYVLTSLHESHEYAMTNVLNGKYATSTDVTSLISEPEVDNYLLKNPSKSTIWKFTGTASSGRFYNESSGLYLDLTEKEGAILKSSTTDNLVITIPNVKELAFDIASVAESSHYLYMWTSHQWSVDNAHRIGTDNRTYLYKRISLVYATTPSCPIYTVTWDVNGASTSTTEVTKCEDYLSALPGAPADNTLSGCQTNGKFMGWSASKVMPAQDIAPADIFSEVEDAPEITEDVTFYAVFANGVAGAATPVNTTYTFNSKSWGDATNSWSSNTAGSELTSERGIQILGNTSAEGITKNNYTDVTKVVVTYCTNASSGAGSVTVTVGDTKFGTNSISKPSSGGATLKTFTYTHAAATGKVKISASASSSSIYIYSVQIYYTGAGTVYEQYRTACCNDPGFSFTGENDAPVTEYVIVRENMASASDAVEIDCNYTSSNTTGAITWYSTRRAAKTFPSTGAYTWTTPTEQPTNLNIDLANKKIAAKETGVWTITISQADGGTTYCPVDAVVTVRVKTVDKFIDNVNGNFSGEAQRLEDVGNGITLPTEATFTINGGCSDGVTRRLVGWIKASDLATYASGGRVNKIDDWKTADPATNKVIAPGTKVQATGVTWYAVWGVEK